MERLTKINGAGRNVIEVRRFCKDDDWIISEMTDGITIRFYSKAIDKLAEFEDFMEEHGFESLDELKCNIECLKDKIETDKFNYNELHKYKNQLYEENQALKARWEKLKGFVQTEIEKDRYKQKITPDLRFKYYAQCELTILNKMQELEEE